MGWGEVIQRFVRSFFVVADHPLPGEVAYRFQVVKEMSIENFCSEGPVKSLDVCVLSRLARLDVTKLHSLVLTPIWPDSKIMDGLKR